VKLVMDACESLVRFHQADNMCVFRNVSHLVGGVVLASVHLFCEVKVWSAPLWADRWVSSLFGGIIFHVLLASISLAPSCESVGDVLAFLLFSFVQA
jgi:hypothetical protein